MGDPGPSVTDRLEYVDFDEEDKRRGGHDHYRKMGAGVRADALAGCRHLVEVEFREELFAKFVATRKNGDDIDFTGWLCGERAGVCDMVEDTEENDEKMAKRESADEL